MDRTFTVQELADLIDVTPKDIQNAKRSSGSGRFPGSKAQRIDEYMLDNGITWDMVVSAGKNPTATVSSPRPAPATVNQDFEDAITAMEAETAEKAAAKAELKAAVEALAMEAAPIVAYSAPEPEPTPATDAAPNFALVGEVGPEVEFVPDVAADSDADPDADPDADADSEAETSASESERLQLALKENLVRLRKHFEAALEQGPPRHYPRRNYCQDFPSLGHIPLEALVNEITRRVPRAEVVLR